VTQATDCLLLDLAYTFARQVEFFADLFERHFRTADADRGLINESLSTEVDRALETLTERERDIIKYFFGIGCSEKRATTPLIIGRLQDLDLSNIPSLEFARDMFLLSFFLRGIPFVDLSYLRKSDVKMGGGTIPKK
jgi:hypothetical protein